MAVASGAATGADRAWAAQTDSSTGRRRHLPHRMVLHKQRRLQLRDRARSSNGALHCDFCAALLGSDRHLELSAAETQVFHLPGNDS